MHGDGQRDPQCLDQRALVFRSVVVNFCAPSGIVTVGDYRINPRCLDYYTTIAYQCAAAAGWVDPEEDC